jgi:alpha-beta hydrolase superfamily lysophospholipase
MCNDCFLKNVAWDSSRTYDVLGPADGKVVVLVHGAIVGRQCMIREARALAEAGYRVLLPDLPAHGKLAQHAQHVLHCHLVTNSTPLQVPATRSS